RGLRTTGDLAQSSQRIDELRPQRWLVPLDAREDAPKPLARQQDEVIERVRREPPAPGEHRRWIGRVADRHQRATDDACAAPLQQRREYFDLATLGNGDGAAGEGVKGHPWQAYAAAIDRASSRDRTDQTPDYRRTPRLSCPRAATRRREERELRDTCPACRRRPPGRDAPPRARFAAI